MTDRPGFGTDRLAFERTLEARLLDRAGLASRPFDASAIARQAIAASPRRGTASWHLWWLPGWPERRATTLLLAALITALAIAGAIGAGAAVRFFMTPRDPAVVSAARMTAIVDQVDALNRRDVDTLIATFTSEGRFDPRGAFDQEYTSLFRNSVQIADRPRVDAWMATIDAWGLESVILGCRPMSDPEDLDPGAGTEIHCAVRTRWHALALEVSEVWQYRFEGSAVLDWGYRLFDLDPGGRELPLGFDGLEAWESWLTTNDPDAAARLLNRRIFDDICTWCEDKVSRHEPGSSERGDFDPLVAWRGMQAWQFHGVRIQPDGLIPYDPNLGPEIGASIRAYLGSR